jgi:hypothetical protein
LLIRRHGAATGVYVGQPKPGLVACRRIATAGDERKLRRMPEADTPCPTPEPDLAAIARSIGADSELADCARQVRKRRDNVLGLLLRDLTREEIAVMEDRGCRCDDWARLQVAQDFDCFRVRRVHFRGRCVLGRFQGESEIVPGIRLPNGLYDCTLIDCQVGNDALVQDVRFAANLVVDREAVLFDIGSLTCSGAATFGCGQALAVGPEVGGREVPLWAECTIDACAAIARRRGDRAGQEAVRAAVKAYAEAVSSPVSWVRRRARVSHIDRLHDVWIGAAARIDHALELSEVAVLSSAEEPVAVGGGAAVRSAVVQWGVTVGGGGIVRRSALLEHSAVDEHAVVETSIIGPNTHLAKGEVTATLLGPFVGFHHQSMLIAAIWPEGKGNVAHGAMVGSNHTGRAPDQEIWPGEGTFFGLGSAIRFPADFSQAPYSVISMGVSTLPQRITYPFSLIAVPVEPVAAEAGIPRACNEIIPAWTLYANAYGLVRNELKFSGRDRARRHCIDPKVFRPAIMRLVKAARDRLAAVVEIKPFYLSTDLDGLGSNFLREENRQRAIAVYDLALTRYALRLLLGEAEGRLTIPGSAEIAHELADALMPGADLRQRLTRLCEIERENAQLVQDSKAKDDERGQRIIPGYADAHVAAAEDPVVQSAWERARITEERVARILAAGS